MYEKIFELFFCAVCFILGCLVTFVGCNNNRENVNANSSNDYSQEINSGKGDYPENADTNSSNDYDSNKENYLENVNTNSSNGYSQEIDSSKEDYKIGFYHDKIYYPSVTVYEDVNLQFRLYDNIHNVFDNALPEEYLSKCQSLWLDFPIHTDKYLSAVSSYCIGVKGDRDEVCITLDMETGDVVYLDNLLNVNEKLAEKIKTYGIAKTDADGELFISENCIVKKEKLDSYSEEDIYQKLLMCSVPYNTENYKCKPAAYLGKNKIYFVNFLGNSPMGDVTEFYVSLDDVEEFLKAEKW